MVVSLLPTPSLSCCRAAPRSEPYVCSALPALPAPPALQVEVASSSSFISLADQQASCCRCWLYSSVQPLPSWSLQTGIASSVGSPAFTFTAPELVSNPYNCSLESNVLPSPVRFESEAHLLIAAFRFKSAGPLRPAQRSVSCSAL
ncbi:unnamed protein product [Polarella glacialis]|uniref:Uncharacterized protein n=1 Tax=Polarella glacialis TaxID=89957 RepID=A0A813GYG7_POLGL|nr:unnamed protein product [Polarella glacialis]